MKFAIRDDDLNFHYTPEFIEHNLREIYQIIPVSMAVIPMVKGNWMKNTEVLEAIGPGNITNEIAACIKKDDEIFPIDSNLNLTQYIQEKIIQKKICIAIHGIHHRNEDLSPPVMGNNFWIGAEFQTARDLTLPLQNAVRLLERSFGEKVQVFTPPQNSYSYEGALAVFGNNLKICGYLPGIRNWKVFIQLFGIKNYLRYLNHRAECKLNGFDLPFPHVMRYKGRAIADHCALQPSTSTKLLMEKIKYTYDAGGDFILSTHSYAFDYIMQDRNLTMKQSLIEIINKVSKLSGVRFTNINEIFSV